MNNKQINELKKITSLAFDILKKHQTELTYSTCYLKGFPNCCCGMASELFGNYLKTNGYENIIYKAYKNGTNPENDAIIVSHNWLEVDNIIIDITYGQFFQNSTYYVGKIDKFHKSFKPTFLTDSKLDLQQGQMYSYKKFSNYLNTALKNTQ